MAISFVNKGTFAGGNGAVTPGLPASMQAGDLCLLFIETANEAATVPTAGSITWTQVATSPQGTGTAAAAGATRITVFYGWYTSGTTAPTTNDSGDHNCAIIMAFRGVDSDTPFDATPTGAVDASATTSLNANPSITTATANALIVLAIGIDADAASTNAIGGTPTNSNLTSITVQHEETTSSSDGGGVGVITGFKATAGATGSITGATTASCTHAYLTMALRPWGGAQTLTATGFANTSALGAPTVPEPPQNFGAACFTWVTPVELSVSAAGAWTDVDVSSYVSGTVSGVMLEVVNTSLTTAALFGGRKKVTTPTYAVTGDAPLGHFFIPVGVDSSKVMQLYCENTTDLDIYLVGYFNENAVFLDQPINEGPSVSSTWSDVDISTTTGTDTAVAALLHVYNSTINSQGFGARKNGSTDARTTTRYAEDSSIVGFAVGCDANEVFEIYTNSYASVNFYLVGYIKSGVISLTNALNVSTSTTLSYVDLSPLPADATGAFFEVITTSNGYRFDVKEKGATHEGYSNASQHAFGASKADANRVISQKIEDAVVDLFLLMYTGGTASSGNQTLTATGFARTTAFGTPALTATRTLIAAGFAQTTAFGTPTLTATRTLTATGFANTSAFGTPTLTATRTLTATALVNTSAFGTPTLTATYALQNLFKLDTYPVLPWQVYYVAKNEQAFGTPTLTATSTLTATGFAQTTAFGTPTIVPGAVTLTATGFANTSAFGVPTIVPGAVTLSATSLVDGPTFGTPTLTATRTLTATGFAQTTAFGTPTLTATRTLTATGFANTSAFGSHTATPLYPLTATGFANTSAFGTPSLAAVVPLTATGFADADAFGTPTVVPGTRTMTAAGFAQTTAFGTPSITGGVVTLSPTSFANTSVFGTPTMVPGAVTLTATGFARTTAFGTPALTATRTLIAAGFAQTTAFGTPTLTATRTLTATGFANTSAFGTPTLTATYALTATALVNTSAFGTHEISGYTSTLQNLFKLDTYPVLPWQVYYVAKNEQAFGTPSVASGGLTLSPDSDESSYALLPWQIVYNPLITTTYFGSPSLSISNLLAPPSIASTLLFGSATAGLATYFLTQFRLDSYALLPWQIVQISQSTVAFGTPTVAGALLATGIESTTAFGSATAESDARLLATGVPHTNAFGTPTTSVGATTLYPDSDAGSYALLPWQIVYTAPITTTLFGSATIYTVGLDILRASGFANSQAFGSATITSVKNLQATGFTGSRLFGTGTLTISASATGFSNTSSFGEPTLRISLGPTGFANTNLFGSGVVYAGETQVFAAGFENLQIFGDAIATSRTILEPPSFSLYNRFGVPVVISNVLVATGVPTATIFGTATIVPGEINTQPPSVTTENRFGAIRLVNEHPWFEDAYDYSLSTFLKKIATTVDFQTSPANKGAFTTHAPGSADFVDVDVTKGAFSPKTRR